VAVVARLQPQGPLTGARCWSRAAQIRQYRSGAGHQHEGYVDRLPSAPQDWSMANIQNVEPFAEPGEGCRRAMNRES
jgi:hypothetical protein